MAIAYTVGSVAELVGLLSISSIQSSDRARIIIGKDPRLRQFRLHALRQQIVVLRTIVVNIEISAFVEVGRI